MQQPATFKVYSASAGSGKTFTLVKEYLKIVLSNTNTEYFKHILAVTFTNKAANEMKQRVISNLKNFSGTVLDSPSPMFIQVQQELNIPLHILKERAKGILLSILDNYSAFNITTIDSFTHRLIRTFAFDLGLTQNFEVEMDAQSLLSETVDALMAKMGEDEALTKILVEFSLQKANEDKSWDITRELRDIAQLLLNDNDTAQLDKIRNKSLREFINLKTNLFKRQRTIEIRFAEIGHKGLSLIEDSKIDHADFYYTQFPKHFLNLIDSPGSLSFDPEKGLGKSIRSGTFYTKGKPEHVKLKIDAVADQLKELYNETEALFETYSLNRLFLTSLIPLAVLSSIHATLRELEEEKNVKLHAEFNQLISKNLREQPAAYIYERLGERFKHFFIDEMQDTSVLQWQNLIPLIHNVISGENAGLQLVGDTKQAIYRWRGSEPEQFLHLSTRGDLKTNNPFYITREVKGLETNYRSYSELIGFNNTFFKYISQFFSKRQYSGLYAEESNQKLNEQLGGYVQLSFVDGLLKKEEKDLEYCSRVLETINTVSKDFDLSEICVLVRKRDQGILVANELTKAGIDIISSETLLLQNSEKVRFIVDLLRYLQNKENKEAKFNAAWFIHRYYRIAEEKHAFFKTLVNARQLSDHLKEFEIDFNEAKFLQASLYEGVEYLIRCFGLNSEPDAYLQFFLDEVLQYTSQRSTDLAAFLDYWEDKKEILSIVVPEGKNAVQIMTIHKAKGLEFPVVIFPFDLDIYFERNARIWYPVSDPEAYEGFDTLLVNYNKMLEASGATGKDLYEAHRNELELDNFNLLYVAFTRAIEQLYIIGEMKKSGTYNTSSDFLTGYLQALGKWEGNLVEYTFGDAKRVSENPAEISIGIDQEKFLSSSWHAHNIAIVPESSLLWDTTLGESISYGNLVHKILSEIRTKDDIETAIGGYLNDGTLEKSQKEAVQNVILSIVDHPKLKEFYSQNVRVLNEREFLADDRNIVIPDRVVINNQQEVVIIDYKTGKPEKKYHGQLNRYAHTLQALNYKVIAKFLVYLGQELYIDEV